MSDCKICVLAAHVAEDLKKATDDSDRDHVIKSVFLAGVVDVLFRQKTGRGLESCERCADALLHTLRAAGVEGKVAIEEIAEN